MSRRSPVTAVFSALSNTSLFDRCSTALYFDHSCFLFKFLQATGWRATCTATAPTTSATATATAGTGGRARGTARETTRSAMAAAIRVSFFGVGCRFHASIYGHVRCGGFYRDFYGESGPRGVTTLIVLEISVLAGTWASLHWCVLSVFCKC
jgi:hypothetical protein